MIYKFRASGGTHAFISRVDAQAVGEFLANTRDKHGRLTSKLVVQLARNEDAPMHDAFEWDDTVAADKFRQEQARCLIGAVVVVGDDGDEHRAFVNVRLKDTQYYQSIEVAAEDDDEWGSVMRSALTAVATAHDRVSEMERVARNCRNAALPFLAKSKERLTEAAALITRD